MKKFFKGFTYAFKGLGYAFSTQLNFKIHCGVAVMAIISGLLVKLSPLEWLWISLAIGLVLTAELVNTALEVLVDLVSPAQHPKAGAIKDLASAAVLLMVGVAVVIGSVIFIPKLF